MGKSMSQDGESSKCFGFVNRYDTKPKRRLFEMLKSQGLQMNQAVTFLSDGGDTVRDLQMYLNPQQTTDTRSRGIDRRRSKEISVVSLRLIFAYLDRIPWCLNPIFLRLPWRRFFCDFAQDCFKDCDRNGLEQVLIETRRPASRQIFRAAPTAHCNHSPGTVAGVA